MEWILLLPILLGFFLTLFFVPFWIERAKRVGLTGTDIHKLEKYKVAEAGGISVLFGFILGTLSYIALKTFYFKDGDKISIEIFALLCSILIVALIGLIDDLLGWKIGLNKKTRIVFVALAAIPLVVINAGESTMMGIDFGLFYPLFFIPLGIVGASTTFNFLAGYNGLEASQGIIVLTSLAIVTWFTGSTYLTFVCLVMIFSLGSFYLYNKNPAKIFPGDTLTYPVGALIGIIAILGNIEKIAIFFFIPYILETGLKIRGKLKKESFCKIQDNGTLKCSYEKFYGLEHIAVYLLNKTKRKATENKVVYLINAFTVLIIVTGLFLFRGTIF